MNLNEAAVYGELVAGHTVTIADRQRLGLEDVSIEALLDAMVRTHGVLLHGTGGLIPAGSRVLLSPGRARFGRPPRTQEAFATDSGGVALLKALFWNVVNLRYPYVITPQSPLTLTIEKWRAEAERPSGYVHFVGPQTHFEREHNAQGQATWQWVTSRPDATFAGAIEVQPADFVHPVHRQRT